MKITSFSYEPGNSNTNGLMPRMSSEQPPGFLNVTIDNFHLHKIKIEFELDGEALSEMAANHNGCTIQFYNKDGSLFYIDVLRYLQKNQESNADIQAFLKSINKSTPKSPRVIERQNATPYPERSPDRFPAFELSKQTASAPEPNSPSQRSKYKAAK